MIITVCGTPGSGHTTISNMLSHRFDMPVLSASSIKNELLNKNFEGDLDFEINKELATRLKSGESCVCDSLLGSFFVYDAVRVLLVREMTSITRSAETMYNVKVAEQKFSEEWCKADCFDPENYDIIVNVTGVDEDVVVDAIAKTIEAGERAMWISPKLVVPETFQHVDPTFLDDDSIEFSVSKCYATYVLSDNYSQCIYKAKHNRLLKVKGASIRNIPAYQLQPSNAYRDWLTAIGADRNLFQMNLMLSRYCYAEMLHDVDKAYAQLIESGNPAKKLFGMGYDS